MRAKRIVQTGIMLAGLAALPVVAQTTDPSTGTTSQPPASDTSGRYGTDRDDGGFDFGWLGLLGLAGLLGLRRHGHRVDRTDIPGRDIPSRT